MNIEIGQNIEMTLTGRKGEKVVRTGIVQGLRENPFTGAISSARFHMVGYVAIENLRII